MQALSLALQVRQARHEEMIESNHLNSGNSSKHQIRKMHFWTRFHTRRLPHLEEQQARGLCPLPSQLLPAGRNKKQSKVPHRKHTSLRAH